MNVLEWNKLSMIWGDLIIFLILNWKKIEGGYILFYLYDINKLLTSIQR